MKFKKPSLKTFIAVFALSLFAFFAFVQYEYSIQGGGESFYVAIFAIVVSCIFAAMILEFVSEKIARMIQDGPLLTRMSLAFGSVSIIAFIGFFAATIWSVSSYDSYYAHNTYILFPHLFLVYLSVPGFISVCVTIISGIIAYRKVPSRHAFSATILGVIAAIAFIILFVHAGSPPFFCLSDKACAVLDRESICYSYFAPYRQRATELPGVCAFVAPGNPLCNGRQCTF